MSELDADQIRATIRDSSSIEVDPQALTHAHLAVEDVLIEFRDSRIGMLGHANGFVVNERDGSPSPVMRLGTRAGLEIGIKAYLAAIAKAAADV